MSTEYHKIHTILKRDPENKYKTLLAGEYAKPEFEALKDLPWKWTEKVDGTNIRVTYESGVHKEEVLFFQGKTDRAQIHKDLISALSDMFTFAGMREIFPYEGKPFTVVLYGEGYGPGIQKGGGRYRDDKSFVLFDVRVGEFWLERVNIENVALKIGIDIVPILGKGSLPDLLRAVEEGMTSKWGGFPAEGVVARPPIQLFNRWGERVICKIKTKDFA